MNTRTHETAPSSTLIAAITVVVCFVVAGVVVIAIAVPEGGNPGSLIALLVGILAPTITSLVGLVKITSVGGTIQELSNGRMDSKIRAAVADVVGPDNVDPEARALVADDRARIRPTHPESETSR